MEELRTILDTLKTEMEERRAEKAAAENEASGKIQTRRATIADLQEQARTAEAERDAALYAELSEKINSEKHFISLDEQELKEIEGRTCYTVEEFKTYAASIVEKADTIEAAGIEAIKDSLATLQELRKEINKAFSDSNAAIDELAALTGLHKEGMKSYLGIIGFRERPGVSRAAGLISELEHEALRIRLITEDSTK